MVYQRVHPMISSKCLNLSILGPSTPPAQTAQIWGSQQPSCRSAAGPTPATRWNLSIYKLYVLSYIYIYILYYIILYYIILYICIYILYIIHICMYWIYIYMYVIVEIQNTIHVYNVLRMHLSI